MRVIAGRHQKLHHTCLRQHVLELTLCVSWGELPVYVSQIGIDSDASFCLLLPPSLTSAQHPREWGVWQASALALLGHLLYFWTLGALFSMVDWIVHHEPPCDAPADKMVHPTMRRSSSRTQLAGV